MTYILLQEGSLTTNRMPACKKERFDWTCEITKTKRAAEDDGGRVVEVAEVRLVGPAADDLSHDDVNSTRDAAFTTICLVLVSFD